MGAARTWDVFFIVEDEDEVTGATTGDAEFKGSLIRVE